jgi:hypothetical protein
MTMGAILSGNAREHVSAYFSMLSEYRKHGTRLVEIVPVLG